MSILSNGGETAATLPIWRRFAVGLAIAWIGISAAYATEGGTSVYPAGVETIMPGRMPGDGGTMLLEFNDFYNANELGGSNGQALVPGFHLRVAAVAGKLVHNWGVHVLGGTLVSTAAMPWVDVHLSAPFGAMNKSGIGNPDWETLVAYKKGDLNWWYGFEVYTPGFSYKKTDLVNVGQHNYATAPSGAFTYMPHHGATEVSSKFQYITNYTDNTTNYRSGNELVCEYTGMQNITKKLAIGGNGFFYQQTTPDRQAGVNIGNQGRDFAFGPEIRYHFNHYAMILKWQKDFLVQNHTVGNAPWLQVGVPLGHPHKD